MSLELKKIQEKDLELVRKWRTSPEVAKYMYTSPKITKKEQLDWFNKIKNDQTKIYWVIHFEKKPIGVINFYDIDPVNRNAFWAYYIADMNVRGKGIGKALELTILSVAFNELKLHKLSCEVFSWNEKVIKIHEKYGSKIEGRFRDHIYKDGQYHDVVRMAILENEYRKEIQGKITSDLKVSYEF